jgi:hypothetical protein
MKYFTFHRESNNFDDILNDINIKKLIRTKLTWHNHMMIGISKYKKDVEKIFSYITLKYGDEMRTSLTKDYSPIPNIDYIPIRK